MSYKTLIIIDNSNELTSLNKEVIKKTVEYFIRNAGNENKTAIAVTGKTAEYLTDFEDSLNTQLKTIESIEFADVNAPGVDVLMDVILDWQKGDLAGRDILYLTGRNIGIAGDYTEEELLFELNNRQYPVYVIACSQDDNEGVIKGLGVLSRISGGSYISTSDVDSDASVEKQLCEKIMMSMKEYRKAEEERFAEKSESIGNLESDIDNIVTEELLSNMDDINNEDKENIYDVMSDENVIYEYNETDKSTVNSRLVIIPTVIVIISLLMLFNMMLKRQKEKNADSKFKQRILGAKRNEDVSNYSVPFAEPIKGETTLLCSSVSGESDTGTRLLYRAQEGVEITLEDRADPTKYFRAHVTDTAVIGRNDKLCDVAITYDDSISARHCELFTRDNRLYCRDLGSSNGTMVNQQKVYQEIEIESGDILRIGRLTFFIQIVGDKHE